MQDILARKSAGQSRRSLAREFGVNVSTICNVIYRENAPEGGRNLTEIEAQEVLRRRRDGATGAELAQDFGVAFSTISRTILAATGERIGRQRRRSHVEVPSDPLALAYLAGIIDGEGCLSRNSRQETFTWQLTVTNTSSALQEWLRPIGGNFYYPKPVPSTARAGQMRKPRFEWKLTAAWDIFRLLTAVEPYLVIKQRKAQEVIDEISKRFGEPPGD